MVRAKLPNVEITRRFESRGKENSQVSDFICNTDIFTNNTCVETFEIQSGMLNYNSQKVVYLLTYRYVVTLFILIRQKRNLEQDLIIIKVHTDPLMHQSSVFMNSIGNTIIMGFMIGSSH